MLRDDMNRWDFFWQVMLALVCIAVTGWATIELLFYLLR